MASRPGGTKAVFDKHAILRAHPLFGQLGTDVLNRLASYAHTKSFAAGGTIFEKGDPGTSLFAVCTGTVKISNQSIGGKDAVFNLISSGGIFGEIALLDGQPRDLINQPVCWLPDQPDDGRHCDFAERI